MNNKIFVTKYFHIVFWIVVSIFLFIYNYYTVYYGGEMLTDKMKILSWIGIFIYFGGLFSWKIVNQTIFTPFALWFTSLFIFCYGHFILFSFNSEIPNLVTNMYSDTILYEAQLFTLYSFLAFLLGALFSIKISLKLKIPKQTNMEFDSAAKLIGWFLFYIGIIPGVLKHYENIKVSILYGYSGLFKVKEVKTGFSNIFSVLDPFLISALFILLYTYRDNKKIYRIFFFSILLYIILELISGNRDIAMPMLVSVAIIDTLLNKKRLKNINWKKIWVYIGLATIVISAFPAFLKTRNMDNKSLALFIENYKDIFGADNPFLLVLAEMGFSARPLIETMQVIPEFYNYHYGETYYWALTAVFPNLFWDQHPASIHSNIAGWVKEIMGISYGPGSSLPTEAFYNFGWWGLLCLIPIGFMIAKLSNLTKFDLENINPFKLLSVCIFLIFSLTLARRGLFDMVRPVTYYCFIPLLLIKFTILEKRRKYKNIN